MNRKYLNISLFVLTAIIISLIVPNYSSFNYAFKIGQTWNGNKIIAAFDFPIQKSEQEYKEDIDLITNNYVPVYELDTTLSKYVLESVVWHFNADDQGILSQKGLVLYNKLSEVLEVGILDESSNIEGKSIIKLIYKNSIKIVSVRNLYSVSSATNEIYNTVRNDISIEEFQTIKELIQPNVKYDFDINQINQQKELEKVSKAKGFIAKGDVIVRNGDVINDTVFNVLDSYRNEFNKRESSGFSLFSFGGYLLYVLLILIVSYLTLRELRGQVLAKLNNILFVLIMYIGSTVAMVFVSQYSNQSVYIIPFMIVPLYIAAFYSTKMAIHQYIFILLSVAMIAPRPIDFFVVNFLGGVVALMIMRSSYRRHTIVPASLSALFTFVLCYTAMSVISGEYETDNYSTFIWFVINSFATVVLYQFLFVIEKVFNFVTKITLFDLCDTNQKLLRDLATNAPGTFQHSVQVSNLSERAAKAIKANDLLARTGALYHDIGKMSNPQYFIENITNDSKPHDNLTPKQSAEIIKNHVTSGIALAKKYKLPDIITEFIATHHSDSLIFYFYSKEIEKVGKENVDEQDFRYPGPKPISKEASICLMCDSIEAASRSLKEYNEETISSLINKIIANQINDNLLANSELELRDIEIIKETLKNALVNIYHSRIVYPDRK